jgi:hypothetical protein
MGPQYVVGRLGMEYQTEIYLLLVPVISNYCEGGTDANFCEAENNNVDCMQTLPSPLLL